jgi:hypothetical protein
VEGTWDDNITMPKIPLSAMTPPTFIEASRTKEIQALLKFGKDSAWPLRITVATAIYLETSLSVFHRDGVRWDFRVRKEINTIRILMKEYAKDGSRPERPEGPGLPVVLLYAPNAEIRIRSKADYVLAAVEECVYRLYQGICDG